MDIKEDVTVAADNKEESEQLTLVVRKPCFGLPTACPECLPVYIYLRFAKLPFRLDFNLIHPDSDQIPYVESGTYVAYNNEKGGVLQSLKEDGIVDLDSEAQGNPEWVSMKAVVESWLADTIMYELWVDSDCGLAHKVYYSDLPWPIGKVLHFKQMRAAKQVLGITKENAERREVEIYRKAAIACNALSTRLGDQPFLFGSRPTSLDAAFLGHVLFALYALPETSLLRSKILEHTNIVKYAENLKMEFIDADISLQSDPASSAPRQGPSNWRAKRKSQPKREKTEEEKKFRRRAKYFLVTQLVAVLVFLSLLGGSDDADVELDDDDDNLGYD